ncbi:MAG: PAS domain-containing protein [Novosphingobium sp.]
MADILQSAIADIYEAAASGTLFEHLPDAIAGCAGARSCVVRTSDSKLAPVNISHSWFTPEMVETYVREQIFLDDVWSNCAVEQGIYDRTIDIGELTGKERYARSRFYRDFIRRFGDDTGQCVGALLRRPEGGFLVYGTHRAARAASFGDDEVRLLALLNPHLLRAASIDGKLAGARREAGQMHAILDRLEQPLITVSATLQVKLANAAAEAIVARADGFALRAGRLTVLDPSAGQRFTRAIGSALAGGGEQGGNLLVPRGGEKPPYRLTIAPLTGGNGTHAMILIDDPDRETPGATRQLCELYGFTKAEADVAILMAQGRSAEEIAAAREVGVATVKTLLQRCFRKSDTTRATQLARMVNRLPR